MKERLINKLTLLDTSLYRIKGLKNTGSYTKEPKEFRKKLYRIYSKLSTEDLKELIELKY